MCHITYNGGGGGWTLWRPLRTGLHGFDFGAAGGHDNEAAGGLETGRPAGLAYEWPGRLDCGVTAVFGLRTGTDLGKSK